MLTGIFGTERLQLAEDVVQEALVRALQTWPYYGVPKNPAAWLTQTAKQPGAGFVPARKAFPRQAAGNRGGAGRVAGASAGRRRAVFREQEIQDDRLRLMFVCCHPLIPAEAQVALALKTLCGFSVTEISRAFLTTEAADCQAADAGQAKNPRGADSFRRCPAGEELGAAAGRGFAIALSAVQRRLQGVERRKTGARRNSVTRRFAWRVYWRGIRPATSRGHTRCWR